MTSDSDAMHSCRCSGFDREAEIVTTTSPYYQHAEGLDFQHP